MDRYKLHTELDTSFKGRNGCNDVIADINELVGYKLILEGLNIIKVIRETIYCGKNRIRILVPYIRVPRMSS